MNTKPPKTGQRALYTVRPEFMYIMENIQAQMFCDSCAFGKLYGGVVAINSPLGPSFCVPTGCFCEFEPLTDYECKAIYISGPITGLPNGNRHAFLDAYIKLLQENPLNIPINPCVMASGMSWDYYMDVCITMLGGCDEIFMLPGWQESKGANVEYETAIELGIKEHKIIRH